MNLRNALFYVLIFSICSCSSPQELYEKGNYTKAFDKVLKDLDDGKKKRKDVVLLNKSFAKIIDQARENMIYLEDGYKVRDLERNFEQYGEVEERYVKARSFIDEDNKGKFGIFIGEKDILVEDAYDEGMDLLAFFKESNNKIDAQNAYFHFQLVKKYGNRFENIDQLMADARKAGTVIYNVDADLDSDFSYQWDVDRKFDDLEDEENFLKIVYDDNFAEYDCLVELDFSRLDVNERRSETVQNFSKEIIDRYDTQVDTSGREIKVPVYVTVNGSVSTVTLRKIISWQIDLEVQKANVNCDLRERRFSASEEDIVEYYTLSGDERAIPNEFFTNNQNEIEDTDDMVDRLIDNLYNQVHNYFY